jgi:hypothetical protein
MTAAAWKAFAASRNRYRKLVDSLNTQLPFLAAIEQQLVDARDGPAYTVETPVVYNEALDELTEKDHIKLILVADNPGRREQAADMRRYLVGPSGKIAAKFFRENPALGIDFQKNVIILNKTPIHTPRTAELRELCRLADGAQTRSAAAAVTPPAAKKGIVSEKAAALAQVLETSQREMARLLLEFHKALALNSASDNVSCGAAKSGQKKRGNIPVWIIGYSEMKKGGIFETYTEEIKNLYLQEQELKKNVFLFRHFSMNQFTIDLHRQSVEGESVPSALKRMGAAYRKRALGW